MRSWNLNQLFGRLDIRTKLAIAFLGLSGVPLALVGSYAANQHLRSLEQAATQQQRRALSAVHDRVQAFVSGVEGDLELLAGSSAVDAFLGVVGATPETPFVERPEQRVVEGAFRDFLGSKRYYYRLRLLADAGVELVHVTFKDGRTRVVAPGEWRGTGYRFYRTLLAGRDPEQVVFAPVELRGLSLPDVEEADGDALQPVAALSFLHPVNGREGDRGDILVADVDARWLFELLQPSDPRPGESLMLVGPDAHYLFHSSKKTDWNTLLATEKQHNLREDLPPWMVERVMAGEAGMEAEELDSVVAYAPLFRGPAGALDDYTLVSIIPKETLYAPVASLRRVIFGAGAITILVAGLLALLAAHQFAAPIRALTQGAVRLAEGRFDTPLDIRTNDEIEDLARTFSSMGRALAERERDNVRQREQLNALLDNMGEGVAVIDRAYRVRFLNRFLQERFGDADGRSCFELFVGLEEPCEECPQARAGGMRDSAVCPCRTGAATDGRHYEILAFPLEDFEGEPAVLEIHRDVTERRRMEEQLKRYTEHLETMVEERTRELEQSQRKLIQQEKMVAVGQLAAGVAHELGTPLATILCHSEMAIEDLSSLARSLPEPARAPVGAVGPQLDVVVGEAQRCRDIVRNLLEFSRPSSHDRQPISASDLARRSASLVEHDLRNRGIDLELRASEHETHILGNENGLVQVLVNLLLNAADAMPGGGRVRIQVDGPAVEAVPGEHPGMVTIRIEDTGVGMDARTQARIFEPFFTTKDPGSGTGLGLWITYNTVADHGGRIEVASSPGEGTRFTVLLPAASDGGGP